MANIARNLLRRRSNPRDGIRNNQVHLARVRLRRHVIASREAKLAAQQVVQLVALGGVALEDLEEGRLRAGGSLGAAELELADDLLDAVEVEHEVLRPLGGSLADGDELCGLEVSVGEGGLG